MKFVLIGPTHPFRGGIAHYTTLLYHALADQHEGLFLSFKRQYPQWLFPGKTDQDTSDQPLTAPCQYLIDPLNPLTWWQTTRQIQQYQPAIIVFQWWVPFWSPTFTTIAFLSHRLTASQIVFICHNVLPHDQLRPGEQSLIKMALKQGDHFIVHSDQDMADLQKFLSTKNIIKTHHPTYAVFSDYYEHQSLKQVINPPKRILFFGFVRPYKGLHHLLDAMPTVLQTIEVELLIVGEFWSDKADYLAQINQLHLNNHVTIIDQYIPNEQVGYYFSQTDVVVLPYRSATQSGIIQLAFGFNKPVITTDVGGLAEVVHHGETGLVVPPNDSVLLAQAIIHYFQANLGPTFEATIRQHQADFSWQNLVNQLEAITLT